MPTTSPVELPETLRRSIIRSRIYRSATAPKSIAIDILGAGNWELTDMQTAALAFAKRHSTANKISNDHHEWLAALWAHDKKLCATGSFFNCAHALNRLIIVSVWTSDVCDEHFLDFSEEMCEAIGISTAQLAEIYERRVS
jgi:hypothetical protein